MSADLPLHPLSMKAELHPEPMVTELPVADCEAEA